MTWTCPKCGRVFGTEEQYNRHSCNPWEEKYKKKCPTCGGTGLVSEFLEPTYKCPTCKGTGKV